MLNLAVLGAWIGLSFAPIAVVSLFIAPGGGLLAVALAVSSIFAPVVVAGGRAVHDELRKRRLHLYQGDEVDLSTVAAPLRAFLIDTRVARRAVEGWDCAEENAVQAVYSWLSRCDSLPTSDRQRLSVLGIRPEAVSEVFFSDLSQRRPRGGLSVDQQRHVLLHFAAFERAILSDVDHPYR